MEDSRFNLVNNLFEVSWEVCNKVGGIHTVISTKAPSMIEKYKDQYLVIGPDLNKEYNNEFEEDENLLKTLKRLVYEDGIRIRVGRWKIPGKPIAILVDFSSLVSHKDEILTGLWKDYRVDSLSGQWDYVESVLFGYAAGKVIESYIRNFCAASDKVVAQFHEWMTASGVLYLRKNIPTTATVFTTHATVMGRCIASNGLNLYEDMDKFNVNDLAMRYNVMAKYSIEKAGAENSDCFTTVSEITANECKYMLGIEPQVITPNGFNMGIVWSKQQMKVKRAEARDLFIRIAEVSLGKKFEKDPLIVGTCGRYEYRNKGLDEFIESLSILNDNENLERDILAYILVPGWNIGPRKDLQEYINTGVFNPDHYAIKNITHYMGDNDNDVIIRRLRDTNMLNQSGRVSVMFVPAYLDGYDGIFNKHYYELLPGFDVTVFPSYYEPWGYTPLESIAFGVPSITSSLAGFGKWIEAHSESHQSVVVIDRGGTNDKDVKTRIAESLLFFDSMKDSEEMRKSAQELSKTALWSELSENYFKAFSVALGNEAKRAISLKYDGGESHEQVEFIKQQLLKNNPVWSKIMIERSLPERLRPLEILSRNLWWSWTLGARSLFEYIDEKLWIKLERNPIALLDNLSSDRVKELLNDDYFLIQMDSVYASFIEYMSEKDEAKAPMISYFSMEYGLHNSLKIYSGGLGILAGDYLKEASDQNIPMIAVGLLYRYGYFTQKLSATGEQEAKYEPQNFYKLPISPVRDDYGSWKTIQLEYPGRTVTARIWRCDVGRTELYLLDTDHEANLPEDRSITHHLYGGDWENRLKQEVLLGIGGIKALRTLGVKADVYHCNEGHAAFIGIKRIKDLMHHNGLSFSEALEVVRSSSLFTTHTPVPAGHDAFPEAMMRQYFANTANELKITWEQFMNLGKVNPNDPNEKFSMSFLACNTSQEVNGVSWLHGEVSKDILGGLWPGYFKEELHIGYVTNGVHFPTWTSSLLRNIYSDAFGDEFKKKNYDRSCWQNIYNVPNDLLWDARLMLKEKLTNYIKRTLVSTMTETINSPSQIVKISEMMKPDVLTIGFARRFATYKRAALLFSNLERLDKIVNNPNAPVQFVFAGKAHPNDKPGQDLIKRVVEISRMPQFLGKVLFLENYNMELARRMVQGVDVWLNTPTRPLEASGTSGEKAVMNGVLHFSVLDGWWVEGYQQGAGWMLPLDNTFDDDRLQDELDAEMIYNIIENDIAPAYYNRNGEACSNQWMQYIKKSIADVASNFTTKRMIEDYVSRFYTKLYKRNLEIINDNYALAREIAAWKRRVSRLWEDNIYIVSSKTYDISKEAIYTGHTYKSEVVIDLGRLSSDDIGVELVVVRENEKGERTLTNVSRLNLEKVEGSKAFYELLMTPKNSGTFDVAIRVFAKNDKLPNRMDFALVKWS